MAQNIFRKESLERVSSPEQLKDYIKVSSGGAWLVTAAVIVLLASLLVWGIVGNLSTTVNSVGAAKNGVVICYFESTEGIVPGAKAELSNGIEGVVSDVSAVPESREKIEAGYGEFENYSLSLPEWSYAVTVKAPGCENGITDVKIIVDSVHPISFLWN